MSVGGKKMASTTPPTAPHLTPVLVLGPGYLLPESDLALVIGPDDEHALDAEAAGRFGIQQVAIGGDGRVLVVEGGHDDGIVIVGHDGAHSLHAALVAHGRHDGGAGVVRLGGHDGVDLPGGLLIVCHLVSPCRYLCFL